MQNYIKLLHFLKGHRKLFSVAILTMFIASFFEGFQLSLLVPMTDRIFNDKQITVANELPGFIQMWIDKLNATEPATLFWIFPILVMSGLLLKHIFTFAYQYLMSDVSQRVMRDLRHRLYERIQNLSLDYFSEKRTGELISRITNDVNVVENALSYGVTDLFRQTFMIILFTTIVFSINPKAALIIFLFFP